MQNKLLSIIIPMYNVEGLIANTIGSILQSSLPKDCYEIIVVDDGSTDGSREVVERLASEHENIRCFRQANGGSSAARNHGLDEAQSKYVWFIDSDDAVEADLSAVISALGTFPDVDIYDFQYRRVTPEGGDGGIGSSHPSVVHGEVIAGRDAILQGYTPGSVCGLILRKAFLDEKGLRFVEGITQQDVELSMRLFANARRVVFFYDIIYVYLLRNGSITRAVDVKKKTKYFTDQVEIVKSFERLSAQMSAADKELSDYLASFARKTLFGMVFNMLKRRGEFYSSGISRAVIDRMKAEGMYPLSEPFDDWKHALISRILNIESLIAKRKI